MGNPQKRRNNFVTLYCLLIWGGVLVWNYIEQPQISVEDWTTLYFLVGLLVLIERFSIQISSGEQFSFETAYLIGSSFVFNLHVVVYAGLASAIVLALIHRQRRWEIYLMNLSCLSLCTVVAHNVYMAFDVQFSVFNALPLFLYGVCYFLMNVLVTGGYLVVLRGIVGIREFIKEITKELVVVYAITIVLGLILAIILKQGFSGAFLLTGLLIIVSVNFKDYFNIVNHYKELSIRDELTGLHNHRYIQSKMDDLIATETPFSLLMLDIDNFKRYNEVLGHVKGDEALALLAKVITDHRVKGMEVARFSGEEFAIIIPNSDTDDATKHAEELKDYIAHANFPGQETGHMKARFSVSFGLASYPSMAEDKRTLLMMVDDALYRGKFTGKNRINIFSSVLDEMENNVHIEDQQLLEAIRAFLAILNSKDKYTYAHTERDVKYAEALGRSIGLSEESMRNLRFGAFLHDIGKVEVPLEILTKRGPLTTPEWNIMKSHVEWGENIVRPVKGLEECLPIIRHHHERYDGMGYPDRLQGEGIPLEARILTIADSFDAMTTSRPYQKKRSMEAAFAELRACAGQQFDPNLVEPFIQIVRETGLLSEEEDVLDEVATTQEQS